MTSRSETKILQSAKWYIEKGFNAIPARPSDKRALIKWAPYQKQRSTIEEAKTWWTKTPMANIAIVTGAISGITVVDVDSKEGAEVLEEFLPDTFQAPTVDTPGGGFHVYFQYVPGIVNKARVLEGCDVRNDGGYVLAPPSQNGGGKLYKWRKGLRIDKVPLPEMPAMLKDILLQDGFKKPGNKSYSSTSSTSRLSKDHASAEKPVERYRREDHAKPRETTLNHENFSEGSRDESIFHVAYQLALSNMPAQSIQIVIERLAATCNPPYDPKNIPIKINSAINRAKNREINYAQEVDDFIETTEGNFKTTQVHKFCLETTRNHAERKKGQKAIIQALLRRVEEGVIERDPNRRGYYQKVDRTFDRIKLSSDPVKPAGLWLPLGLSQMCYIYPGDIVAITGSPNSGKTAFMLSVARYNFKKFQTRYLSSEIGGPTMALRCQKFNDCTMEDWDRNLDFGMVYSDWHTKINPGEGNLTIIDYIEAEEAWRIPNIMRQIHSKLNGGIAIVALQKNYGKKRLTGIGGDQTAAKPTLYLSMDRGWMKILKCKSFDPALINPNGMECEYSLVRGYEFEVKKDWKRG